MSPAHAGRAEPWLRALLVLVCFTTAACGPEKQGTAVTAAPPRIPTWAKTERGCPVFGIGTEAGRVTDPRLDELSGLVVSRRNPDVLWAVNDSGNTATLYSLTAGGALLGETEIAGVSPRDIEDLAITTPGPGGVPRILVGDIGDNRGVRDSIRVYRVPEPADPADTQTAEAEVLEAVYPDGAHNAEALMADPTTGYIYVVTSGPAGTAHLYGWSNPAPGTSATLEDVASIPLDGLSVDGLVTSADMADDGSAVVVRTYTSLLWWNRTPGQPLAEVFATEPCTLPLHLESQGEAVALTPGVDAYWTASEGTDEPLYRYPRE
ncbi:MAG: hypothetical protein IT198_07875 [Acidimicrobiia bacterium]|nr:hypothetical protein [Acidimicrobiia bacterium]